MMDSDAGLGSPTEGSEADNAVVGLTLGYRWENGAAFYGAELDMDVSSAAFTESATGLDCETSANGPYWCSHDASLRLRGIYGYALSGGYDIFGTLGVVAVYGESAINVASQANVVNTGFTVGFGGQMDFQTGTGRLELIYDRADSSDEPGGFDPDYEAATLKATYLY